MKRLLVTALILAPGLAMADSHGGSGEDMSGETGMTIADHDMQSEAANRKDMDDVGMIRSRDITGGNVYALTADTNSWAPDDIWNGVGSEWTQVGTIEDLVLSENGKLRGIVAEVGGFLDLGDKHVMLPVDDVNLVAVDDRSYAYVTRKSEEQLEELQSLDEGFWN